jgi:hypothetical protein
MIKTIHLKFGKGAGSAPASIETTPVTVFVGPNNSGKSQVLAEIQHYCLNGDRDTVRLILDSVEFQGLAHDVAHTRIKPLTLQPQIGESISASDIVIGKRGQRMQVNKDRLLSLLANPNSQHNEFCAWYLRHNTLMLNGANRINLVNEQNAGDLLLPAHNSLHALFRDDDARAQVRRIIHEAFGLYFVIDPNNIGKLRIKLASRAPSTRQEEQGWDEGARRFHEAALPIGRTSDGVKAYTGMITEIIAGDPIVLLIDEPEAFLHPSLSFKLGKEIAGATYGSEKRLFVALPANRGVAL